MNLSNYYFNSNIPIESRHRNLLVFMHFLKEVPEDRFDISYWRDTQQDAPPNTCGTAGCVAGWAVDTFWNKGLSFTENNQVQLRYDKIYVVLNASAFAMFFGLPRHLAKAITMYFLDRSVSLFERNTNPTGETFTYESEFGVEYSQHITPMMASKMIEKVLNIVAPELMKCELPEEEKIHLCDL